MYEGLCVLVRFQISFWASNAIFFFIGKEKKYIQKETKDNLKGSPSSVYRMYTKGAKA